AIPTAVMAVAADLLMAWLERALSPVKKKKRVQPKGAQPAA
ncbi:ABC transporter permease, partial [Bacillus atrophaeus]|nr:ABC transporter permease [Bacillus atrophaeus]